MSRTQFVVRGALLVGALSGLYACDNGATVVSPKISDDIFRNYVAIGNSITILLMILNANCAGYPGLGTKL